MLWLTLLWQRWCICWKGLFLHQTCQPLKLFRWLQKLQYQFKLVFLPHFWTLLDLLVYWSLGKWYRQKCFPFPHQFLQVVVTPNMNIVKEDLRDCAASCQLLHLCSQLWMTTEVYVTYRYSQASKGGLGLRAVWATLDWIHSYSPRSTALIVSHRKY